MSKKMKKKKSRKSISNSDIIKKKKKEVIEEEEDETLPTTESSETETEVEETNAKDSETEDSNNKKEEDEEIILNNDTDVFNSLVQMVQEAPEDILLSSSSSSNGGVNIENTLINNIQYLFSRIEATGGEYMKLLNHQLKQTTSTGEEESEEEDEDDDDENTNFLYPFSGLEKLYISNSKDDDFLELLWSQVDLQNQSLLPKLKSAFKKKKKKSQNNSNNDDDSDTEIEAPVLMKISDSDSEEESDESSQSDGSSESVSENEDKESEDEETKRIRQRMERSMLDMDDMDDGEEEEEEESYDSEDEDIQDNKIKKKKNNKKKVEDFDPAAEELNDGFFDLNDMEDFADEEEDFHLFDDGDGDDNDDDDDDGSEEEKEGGDFKRKKKYREEEDIDALHSMYTDNFDEEEEDDDDEVDPAELTAADFFGQPNKKYHGRFKFVNGKFIRTDKKNDKESGMKNELDEESWDKSAEKEDEEDENDWPTRNNNASDSQQMEQDESSDEEDEEDEVEEEEEIQGKESTTTHAKQQAKLAKQIKQYEEELLMEKPWQMKGETKATSRPVDSLLDSTPEFELANKQAPAITVEHTTSLEEVIKRRIIENDWDDIVPRELPSVFKQHNNRSVGPEVSQEKSKLGLGELYEREYLKKAVGYDVEKEEKQTQEDKAKMEMRTLFASLCSKLDAMSNYHFAPRPVDQSEAERADNEINVLANKPAISVEDIIPTFVSDKRTLVPKDIYKGTGNSRGKDSVLKGESELSQQDRQRARQTKKSKRRKERKEKLADERILSKLNPLSTGLNNPYEKRKIREDLSFARSRGKIITAEENPNSSNYNSSTKFFKELQDSTRSEIRNNYDDGNDSNKRRKVGDDSAKSSSYKL